MFEKSYIKGRKIYIKGDYEMERCKTCGIQIIDGNVCTKCGCFINDEAIEMATKEDHIKVLNNMMMRVRALDNANKSLNEYVTPPRPAAPAEKTFWGCFWPYLIVAIVVGNIVTFFGGIAGVIAFFVSIFIGIFVAKTRRDNYNEAVWAEYSSRMEQAKKYPQRSELEATKQKCKKDLAPYLKYVPAAMMETKAVKELINNIETGKANTISEAVEVYQKGNIVG